MSESKVYSLIPRTGLGNMFLVWAKGYAFAKKHQLPFVHSGFTLFFLGPWLRQERSKRFYFNYFKHQPLLRRIKSRIDIVKMNKVFDPAFDINIEKGTCYLFKKVYVNVDYFHELKPFRKELKDKIFGMLQRRLHQKLNALEVPEIGVHIRRGDFKLGSTITPMSFFVDVIVRLRAAAGRNMKVTLFSDATDEELSELLSLPAVERVKRQEDIIDLLLLSKSRYLVLSIGSTFSYWAGFLSDGQIIKSSGDWHPDLRPAVVNKNLYEGKWDGNGDLPSALAQHFRSVHLTPSY